MLIADALAVRVGTKVTSRFTTPPLRPLRVTDVWANRTQTIVRFRIHSLGDAWVDSAGVELPPAKSVWDDWQQHWKAAPLAEAAQP